VNVTWEGWLTLGCIGLVLATLTLTRLPADVAFLGSLTILLVAGVLDTNQALSGLSNDGMVTVGVLYVVVAGLRETGGIQWISQTFWGHPKTLLGAQARLVGVVTGLSAFLNNTPVVAMLIPAVTDWARRHRFSVSKLMIPLSYAAILGGTCTLIGTSTNLVVNGLVTEHGLPPLGMFDITWVGVPCAVVGFVYILVFSRSMLPDRKPVFTEVTDPREYTVEMLVEAGSPLVSKTIEAAGLRHLPGMFLAEIEREGRILPAVGPQEVLRAKDRLVFVGVVESVVDLQKIRGLAPATDQVFKLDAPRVQRCLIEAVVSNSCRMLHQTIRDGRFRSVYNAVVIAVARNGVRIRKKIGDIILQPGDTLLLETTPQFLEQQRNSRDFFLVSRIEDSQPLRHEKASFAVIVLLAMVMAVTFGWLSMLQASMLAAGLMILGRCCTPIHARRSVDWQVLIVIAAALGLGQALETTGTATIIAATLQSTARGNPYIALAVIYGITVLFTELITNNSAAALVFPIALATAERLEVNPMAFIIAVMMAASASFATPIGYQTNLMVYGPGGYRFGDYFRFGIPLTLLLWGTTLLIAPLAFPFHPAP
jgi:di/tricarboxylate transporter